MYLIRLTIVTGIQHQKQAPYNWHTTAEQRGGVMVITTSLDNSFHIPFVLPFLLGS